MNHKTAIPENGTKFKASATVLELVCNQAPESCGSAGTAIRSSENTIIKRMEKMIPAKGAALGVFRFDRVNP